MDKKTIERLRNEIKGLSPYNKYELDLILDLASISLDEISCRETLDDLRRIYDNLKDQYEKEVILRVMNKYKNEERKISVLMEGTSDSPITLKDFLLSISDSLEEHDGKLYISLKSEDLLDKPLRVGIDDGMGYTPTGYHGVISGYPGEDDIKLWI